MMVICQPSRGLGGIVPADHRSRDNRCNTLRSVKHLAEVIGHQQSKLGRPVAQETTSCMRMLAVHVRHRQNTKGNQSLARTDPEKGG